MVDASDILKRIVWSAVIEEEIRLSMDSIDNQVDAILLRFETDSTMEPEVEEIPSADEPGIVEDPELGEAVNRRQLSILLEQPPKEDEEEDEPAGGEETGTKEPEFGAPEEEEEEEVEKKTGSIADEEPDKESEPLAPRIDLNKFAGKVSRLVVQHPSLLDIPMAIANRARNYVDDNYGRAVADEFAEILERDFEIELERPDASEPVEKPIAVGAAATSLGGV